MIKKFDYKSSQIENSYIENGYVTIKNIFNKDYINNLSKYFYHEVKVKEKKLNDYHDICNQIMDDFESSNKYDKLIFQEKLKNLMIRLLGYDLCVLNYTALWVNTPTNKNPVLKKNEHVDAWTGTGINTIFVKVFLSDCDKFNGITVYILHHAL